MANLKYVGRAPNSNASIMPKSKVDADHTAALVTPEFLASAVATQASASVLVTKTYIDTADNSRAKKAAVDAADATYLPTTARGSTVASVGSDGYIPAGQLPTLTTYRPVKMVGASAFYLTGAQTLTNTTTKGYQAAALTIADPGYAYCVLPFGQVSGHSSGVLEHSRRVGGASRGKMLVLSSTDVLYGSGIAANGLGRATYQVLPTATQGATPTPLTGSLTLNLWLSLHSGSSYIFDPEELDFFALVYPA